MPRLSRIFVYPVKGLGGIELSESEVEIRGLRHDRRWMLTDPSGLFLSQRKLPQLARMRVSLEADGLLIETNGMPPLSIPFLSSAGAETMNVQIWRDVCLASLVGRDADAWITEALGSPSRLVYMPDSTRRPVNPKHSCPNDMVSFADGYPILAISEASLEQLNGRLSTPLSMDRFRPNLVVSGVAAHEEDDWLIVKFPHAILQGAKPCARCTVTTVDQALGAACGPEPLRELAKYRRDADGDVLFGQNLLVKQPGIVQVGDELVLSEPIAQPSR